MILGVCYKPTHNQKKEIRCPISADNGIYIGIFPVASPCVCFAEDGKTCCGTVLEPPDHPDNNTGHWKEVPCPLCKGKAYLTNTKEYRVISAQAIENCDYTFGAFSDQDGNCLLLDEHRNLQDNERLMYYGRAAPFATEAEAMVEANRLYKEEIEGDFGICEYGICSIEYERPLPNKTRQQAEQEMETWNKAWQDKANLAQEERDRNTKVYYVLAPVRVVEYNNEFSFGGMAPAKLEECREKYGAFETEELADRSLRVSMKLLNVQHDPFADD